MKKELNNYSPIVGIGKFDDWSYCEIDKMWYEDEKEVLLEPEAKSSLEFNCDIKVDYHAEPDDKWEDATEEGNLESFREYLKNENSSDDNIISAVLFQTNDCSYILNCNQYGILDIEEFIEKIKKRNFAAQYIEQHCSVKLFCWKKEDNKVHFAIQVYNSCRENDYLKFVFSVIIDETQLINGLSAIVNKWKNVVYNSLKKSG